MPQLLKCREKIMIIMFTQEGIDEIPDIPWPGCSSLNSLHHRAVSVENEETGNNEIC